MGRRSNRDPPHLPPVEHIELDKKHAGLRLALALGFLVTGAALLGWSLTRFLTPEAGWTVIEADASLGATEAGEFTFLYWLDGKTARVESRELTGVYTRLSRTAFELWHTVEEFDGVVSLCTLNRHPNEVFTIDPALYTAFQTLEAAGSRAVYLGPVLEQYENLFLCQEDTLLSEYDPFQNEILRRSFQEISDRARDPESIRLELLGENQARLFVSEDYLAYAEREGVTRFLDFGWLKNAFISDYVAEGLRDAGYTRGVLTSYDGFARCLDESGELFSLIIRDRQEEGVYQAAAMDYSGPMAIVAFRDYPLDSRDALRCREMPDGALRHSYLDMEDGLCRSALHDLACYSQTRSCAEIALAAADVYIARTWEIAAADTLAEAGIWIVYCQNGAVVHSQADLQLRGI